MADPKRKPVQTGDTIAGKYRVERVIGEGGMGMVVRAMHVQLRTRVAIKILLASDDHDQVVRFMREARAAVRLKSEHVVRVTDVGTLEGGEPYMVMELLEGEDLGDLLERGPLAPPDAVALILQACEGLAEAHALGIVHRDIKPRNIFLTQRPNGSPLVKVVDFGLAKESAVGKKDAGLTTSTASFGSPAYMSPEQLRSARDVDARADVWSLGVTLYELLTRRLPFEGPSVHDMLAGILKDPPTPMRARVSGISDGLERIVDRCLAKDVAERFLNVFELATALQPFAPPSAQGAAESVRDVLFSPQKILVASDPPPASQDTPARIDVLADTRTADTRNAVSRSIPGLRGASGRTLRLAFAGGAAVVVALALVAAAQLTRFARSGASVEAAAAAPQSAPELAPASASEPTLLPPASAPDAATAPLGTPKAAITPPKRPGILPSSKSPSSRPTRSRDSDHM